ncbi:Sugar lactone lactonase YvrE [Yoonia tamlensis]|uniref:Sugar lactone lactonase YvrE n=1 Tax=Yoonia tamlensis TaxID=390270 RepID=A0A1I6HDK3_9RHOB|nr:SMP-30/gluconolactonase/LRE family protein [Yoonia tamlensis]SFR52529.1 Sugar lactone lactonase YvrE [Yoonia tamlensis]
MKNPICVDPVNALCGEGLLWDQMRSCLWWVDITAARLHSYTPATGEKTATQLPYLISGLALHETGDLLIATINGLGTVDPASGAITILHDPEPDHPGNRLNDMAASPDGDLWVGSMSEGVKGPTGALYRYDSTGCSTQMTGTTLSNGLDWSPDGKTLYFIDSVPGVLHKFTDGQWSVLARFDAQTGCPDGLCVDQAGTLWIAICDRGQVIGMTPKGDIIETITLPCTIVTNCAFGGADLRTLFVTTGNYALSPAERKANPQAGNLYAIPMETPGRAPFLARWPQP